MSDKEKIEFLKNKCDLRRELFEKQTKTLLQIRADCKNKE